MIFCTEYDAPDELVSFFNKHTFLQSVTVCVCAKGCLDRHVQYQAGLSSMRVNVAVADWGPSLWRLIHVICTRLRMNEFMKFGTCISYLLPCEECRVSFTSELDAVQGSFNSVHAAYNIHTSVNERLNKQNYAQHEVLEQYNKMNLRDVWRDAKKQIKKQLINGVDVTQIPFHESCTGKSQASHDKLIEITKMKICFLWMSNFVANLICTSHSPDRKM